MTPQEAGVWMLWIVFWGVFITGVAYVLFRTASFAWFRSRYEHIRMLRRLKKEDERNG